jgi:nitroreductase
MELYNALIERRSIKKYKPDPVPQDIVRKICTAGTYAPSGRNRQPAIILAVTDKSVRDRLSAINARILGTDADPFYGAPCVLCVLVDRQYNTSIYDGSLVMQNLMLAAYSLGLGSCWIHRARETFDDEEGKAILRDAGIEGDYEGIGNCIIGYAAEGAPAPSPRKEGFVYYI